MSGVEQKTVGSEEDGIRLDRWFAAHYPNLPFGRLQKLIRTGQVRVDRGRTKTSARLASGQIVRVPPVDDAPETQKPKYRADDASFLCDIIIYEDKDVFVLNKPPGIAVQGGSGTKRHIDGMLKSMPNRQGEFPRLVHRLDRDTSGCLLVARTRAAASHFGKVFGSRSARKIYWALVAGQPHPLQGRISCFLARQSTPDGEQMCVVDASVEGAQHALTHYSVTDTAGGRFSWVTLKPVTGRTHQLRVHMAELGTPIIDDPRYFNIENWQRPDELGNGLHLHARRLSIPLQSGQRLDISSPLPPHMVQSFEALGFDASRYDAQDNDPEDEG
jgi:23S rRNA pseudouridine955/2504/2580 synthase